MNPSHAPTKPSRKWPIRLWIVVLSLLFPVVAMLWAGAIAEGMLGDMEPMFIVGGTFVIASVVALVSGAVLICISTFPPSRSLLVVLIGLSIFELISIPMCWCIGAWGRHQRALRFPPVTLVHSHPNQTSEANKTDAGNGSKAICRVSNVLRSPSPDPKRSPNKRSLFP